MTLMSKWVCWKCTVYKAFRVFVNKKVKAPVKKNQKVGYIEYYLNDKSIGKSDIVSVKNVEKADYFHTIKSFGLRLLQLQYS